MKKRNKQPVFLIYIKRREGIQYLPEEYNSKEDAIEDLPKIKAEYNLTSDSKVGIEKIIF